MPRKAIARLSRCSESNEQEIIYIQYKPICQCLFDRNSKNKYCRESHTARAGSRHLMIEKKRSSMKQVLMKLKDTLQQLETLRKKLKL